MRILSFIFSVSLLFATAQVVTGQGTGSQGTGSQGTRNVNQQTVPNGSKLKFKGVVIGRDGNTVTVRDRSRTDYLVAITDKTSIKSKGGFLGRGKKYADSDLLRGLIVEVEGKGDADGKLLADKVRFVDSDFRAAVTTDTRVAPVEENQERIAGQIDELHAIAKEAKNEVAVANERITNLDDYEQGEAVTVNFKLNSAVLSPDSKANLDTFAQKVLAQKWYVVEVSGYTDSTGSESTNFALSQRRAEAVIQYLAVLHKIPARRFVSAIGYGKTDSVADNKTSSGRAQNRRVTAKLLLNRGGTTTTQKVSN